MHVQKKRKCEKEKKNQIIRLIEASTAHAVDGVRTRAQIRAQIIAFAITWFLTMNENNPKNERQQIDAGASAYSTHNIDDSMTPKFLIKIQWVPNKNHCAIKIRKIAMKILFEFAFRAIRSEFMTSYFYADAFDQMVFRVDFSFFFSAKVGYSLFGGNFILAEMPNNRKTRTSLHASHSVLIELFIYAEERIQCELTSFHCWQLRRMNFCVCTYRVCRKI